MCGRSIVAGLVLGAVFLVASGCGGGEAPGRNSESDWIKAADVLGDASTEVAPRELGSAAWIPVNAAYYSAVFRARRIWEIIRSNRDVRRIQWLPLWRSMHSLLERHPAYQTLLELRERDPLIQAVFDLAEEAVSHEVFLYVGQRVIPLLDALGDLYGASLFLDFRQRVWGDPRARSRAVGLEPRALIPLLLEHEKDLRVPPMILGFRLEHPDRARELLERLAARVGPSLPVPIDEETVGSMRLLTVRLSGRTLYGNMFPGGAGMIEDLRRQGVTEEMALRLEAFIDSQSLVVSVGLRDDYLLVSLGPDNLDLASLGRGASLGSSNVLAPVRRCLKGELCSLTFVDSELASDKKVPIDAALKAVDGFLASVPADSLPDRQRAKFKKDLRAFLDDVNRSLPEPRDLVSASYLNRGIETFTFSGADIGQLGATKPLTIAHKAGSHPLVLFATRWSSILEDYNRVAHWLEIAYGYVKEFAVPRGSPEDRREFRRFDRLFPPTIAQLGRITEKFLLPAIDASQGLFTMDGGPPLAPPTGGRAAHGPSLSIPRPALVVQVQDPAMLEEAFRRYRETLNQFLERAGPEYNLAPSEIPPPVSRPHAGGTLYTYPLPASTIVAIEPHALVTGNLAVLSIAYSQSKDIIESVTELPPGEVSLQGAAGRIWWVDLEATTSLLLDGASAVVDSLAERGQVDPEFAALVRSHVPVIQRALSALKTYEVRVYRIGDLQVRHSWLHVEGSGE